MVQKSANRFVLGTRRTTTRSPEWRPLEYRRRQAVMLDKINASFLLGHYYSADTQTKTLGHYCSVDTQTKAIGHYYSVDTQTKTLGQNYSADTRT